MTTTSLPSEDIEAHAPRTSSGVISVELLYRSGTEALSAMTFLR